jgi:prevent-host-death family protein
MTTSLETAISAADANREFSRMLRTVREGQTYVITSHGKPVAKLVPLKDDNRVTVAARTSLLARLHSQKATDIGRWTRDELYEDTD